MSNTLNTPVEALELELPIRVERYELLDGSGGDGRHRGGDGLVRSLRVLEPATLSLLTDRRRHAPHGLDGGEPGRPGRNLLNGEELAAEGDARARRRRRRHGRDSREAAAGACENRAVSAGSDSLCHAARTSRCSPAAGTFVDDVQVARPLHVAFARSPWAHAEIRSVDLSAALAAPGVAAALAGTELPELTEPFAAGITHRLAYYAMAVDRARYAGEPVVAIAAESRYLAEDAAELVVADYEPLDAVVSVEDALDPAKPLLHEQVGSNIVVDRTLRYGDPDGAFARADLVVTETLRWERYSSTPIETYGIVADYEPASGLLTMWANFMGPMTLLPVLARSLRMPEEKLRVIVPKDIGGSFGIKSSLFPYMTVVGAAGDARRPAGEVGRGPRRAPDRLQPPARPRRHARARADEGRRDHRPACPRRRQPRRLRPRARAGDDVPAARQLRRPVPRAGRRAPPRRRRLEQGADRPEPRLRLPAGLPRDGADAGRGGASSSGSTRPRSAAAT